MSFDLPADPATYLNDLIVEMRELLHSNVEFKYAQILVSNEIGRAWSCFQQQSRNHGHDTQPASSPISRSPTQKVATGDAESPSAKPSPRTPVAAEEKPLGECILQTKVYIPEAPQFIEGRATRCNYIGRILGPSGITAKNLEKQLDCTILIRGRGSVRDSVREARLIGRNGWEHLEEPLHVLVLAKDVNYAQCEEKLKSAAEKIEALLTPEHDGLKKDQLMQLAIINGTYTDRMSPKDPRQSD
ncbi:unnamed protein product [Caenorhabditis auriculariae]|uniref:KHDC4/BBP-like KH-domain type I domain-containing protein n=1 Tax=Caenorhabditis auriculariae TaxID=2777116 RepID=A0A8S1HBV5_9PELO|nr:unnamed protein product [Caenorhabditis auriculariae]